MIYDISRPVYNDMPVWPGDPPVVIERAVAGSAPPAVSRLSLGSHTGTHVDPPAHYFPGAATVDELSLDVLCGPAWVAHMPSAAHISAADLNRAGIAAARRLLLRTANSERSQAAGRFDADFIALLPDAADWLVANGVQLVGIDGPSIEPFAALGEPVHRALLGAGVVIVEGLALAAVPPGPCELLCLPLKLIEGDGAPARAAVICNR